MDIYHRHHVHGRSESEASGLYLIVAGLVLLIAAFVFSRITSDELAAREVAIGPASLTLTQAER
jgi:hypothetical protein